MITNLARFALTMMIPAIAKKNAQFVGMNVGFTGPGMKVSRAALTDAIAPDGRIRYDHATNPNQALIAQVANPAVCAERGAMLITLATMRRTAPRRHQRGGQVG